MTELSADCTRASGLALDPVVSMTRRTFDIQLCDKNGSDFSTFVKGAYQQVRVKVEGVSLNGNGLQIPAKVNDRGDGTISVDYVIYSPLSKLIITIQVNHVDIPGSPFIISNYQSDACDCPLSEADFLRHYKCPPTDPQLLGTLKSRFGKGIERSTILEGLRTISSQASAVMQYIIKDNRIYAVNHTEIAGFRAFFDKAFASLARKVRLPDAELVINLGDWPLVKVKDPRNKSRDKNGELFPVFSGCVDEAAGDILIPTWVMLRYLFNQAVEDIQTVDSMSFSRGSWEEKRPKAIWRGRDASNERLVLMDIAKQRPDLIDAGLTHFFFFRDKEVVYGRVPSIDMLSFWDYKYILNLDGTVAAYRLMAMLAGNSLVFKQDSPYKEWFYYKLKPYVHYVPIRRDLSDLVDRLEWAKAHDDEAKNISETARRLIRQELTPARIYCNLYHVLKEYSKLLKFQVEVQPDVDPIPNQGSQTCVCPLFPKREKKQKKEKEENKENKESEKIKKDEL